MKCKFTYTIYDAHNFTRRSSFKMTSCIFQCWCQKDSPSLNINMYKILHSWCCFNDEFWLFIINIREQSFHMIQHTTFDKFKLAEKKSLLELLALILGQHHVSRPLDPTLDVKFCEKDSFASAWVISRMITSKHHLCRQGHHPGLLLFPF